MTRKLKKNSKELFQRRNEREIFQEGEKRQLWQMLWKAKQVNFEKFEQKNTWQVKQILENTDYEILDDLWEKNTTM